MSADTTRFASPEARDTHDTRRARVAPLLAAGLSLRAISAQTGIPVGAVHRAKRQLEKMVSERGQVAVAISFELPLSYLVKQDIKGVRQDVRQLTVSVYERAVESAIGRRLLGRGDRGATSPLKMNHVTGVLRGTQAHLAAAIGLNPRTLRAIIKTLRRGGHLTTEKGARSTPTGCSRSGPLVTVQRATTSRLIRPTSTMRPRLPLPI